MRSYKNARIAITCLVHCNGICQVPQKLFEHEVPGTRQMLMHKKTCDPYINKLIIWATSSEFGTYHLCEQWRFRRACASAQSRQNLRYSLIQAVSQKEPSDRKADPWPLWMAGHAQLKFVMLEDTNSLDAAHLTYAHLVVTWALTAR